MLTTNFLNIFRKLNTKLIFCIITLVSLIILIVKIFLTNGQCLNSFFFYSYSDYITFGSPQMDTGMDFFNSIVCTNYGLPYTKYNTLYPPLANLFFAFIGKCIPVEQKNNWSDYDIFYLMRWTKDDLRLHQTSLLMFIIFIISSVLLFIYIVEIILKENNITNKLVAISLLFSYGNLYAIERGNIIIIVIPLVLFFWFYKDSKNKVIREISLLSLAIAAGIKLYPALFGLVLIKDKQYNKAVRTVFYGLCTFFIPFYAFEGNEAIKIFFTTLFNFASTLKYNGYGFINFYNILLLFESNVMVKELIIGYFFIISIIILVFSFFTNKSWKCCLCLTILIILLQSSNEYTLSFLIIPFVSFLKEEESLNKDNWLYYIFFLFLIVPLPLTKFIIPSFYTIKCLYLQLGILLLSKLIVLDGFFYLKTLLPYIMNNYN